jgi:multiple sugar transport system substrate-binding protein
MEDVTGRAEDAGGRFDSAAGLGDMNKQHGRMLTVLLFLLSAALATPALAEGQAERALNAVRDLVASGKVAPNTVLRLGFKQGNVNAYLGNDLELQQEWERETGIIIETRLIPQLPVQEVIKTNRGLDLTVARNHEFPELLPLGLIADLTPLIDAYGFSLANDPVVGYIRPDLQAYFGDRVVAIPADGDPVVMYLRRDLLEDPAERTAFRATTGRELGEPETWDEFEETIRFFHRPADGLYGVVEERDPEGAWMYWLPRYLSQASPYQPLFDAQMRPLLDTPQGVAATESYVASVRYAPPEITAEGNNYSYTLPLYMQGKVFAMLHTPSASKLLNSPASTVRDRVLLAPIPGQRLAGRLNRRNTLIYGNNLVVPSNASHPELGFLYAMWITSPEVSPRSVGVRGGFTDPYRWNHLTDARIQGIYGNQALEVFAAAWDDLLPPGTGIPGDSEYLGELDAYLTAAARGEISPAEAMRATAEAWESITERLGRASQIAHWKSFKSNFRTTP